MISWNIFGTLGGGCTFDIAGSSAFSVDTNPETVVLLTAFHSGTITDLNIGLSIGDAPAPSAVPAPAAVWLFGTGLIGLIGIRKKST